MSDDIDWRARASCRDHDPELWFPAKAGSRARIVEAEAPVMICLACPVQTQCLAWAIKTDERWAIAGGRDFGAQSAKRASAKGPS